MEEEGTKKKDKYAQEKGQICSRKRRNISKKEDKYVLEKGQIYPKKGANDISQEDTHGTE